MAVRKILTIPDPHLKRPVEPVDSVTSDIESILRDLSDTVDDSPGVALAAPQINEMVSAICVDISQDRRKDVPNHGKVLMINPKIVDTGEPKIIREGCLSVPDYTADIERYQILTVRGTDPEGKTITLETEGWEAVAFQHEIDHLNGLLFLDRIQSMRRDLFQRK